MPVKLVAASLLLVAAFIYLFVYSPVFKIKTLTLNGEFACVDKQELQESLNGLNIFLTAPDTLESKIKGKYACIKKVKVQKKFPQTLYAEVSVADIAAKIADTELFVTTEGEVIRANVENKPLLYIAKENVLKESEFIKDDLILYTVKLASLLSKSDFSPESIRILSPTEITAYNRSSAVAIFTSKKEGGKQIDSLQYVLAKAKIDASKIAKIDLRFDKPIIVNK